jgi:hypothetical protein
MNVDTDQKTLERPTIYHQCKHWWLPSFSPACAGENANESLPVYQTRQIRTFYQLVKGSDLLVFQGI